MNDQKTLVPRMPWGIPGCAALRRMQNDMNWICGFIPRSDSKPAHGDNSNWQRRDQGYTRKIVSTGLRIRQSGIHDAG